MIKKRKVQKNIYGIFFRTMYICGHICLCNLIHIVDQRECVEYIYEIVKSFFYK